MNSYTGPLLAGLVVVAVVAVATVATAGIALVALCFGAVAGGAAWVGLGLAEQIAGTVSNNAVGQATQGATAGLIIDSTCEVVNG